MDTPPQVGEFVRPLGYSYTLGQGRLHANGTPGGDYLNAYKDQQLWIDLGLLADGTPAGDFNSTNWSLQDLITQVGGNGPIPKDVETTTISGKYDAKDISLERHVYFYAMRGPSDFFGGYGQGTGLRRNWKIVDFRLCLNLSGYSPSMNKWMVPSDGTTNIPYYTLKDGTTLAEGQWEHYTGLVAWGSDANNIKSYESVINTLVTIIGQSYGSEILGFSSVAFDFANKIIANLPSIAALVQSGNSNNLLSMLGEVVEGLVQDTLTNTHLAEDFKASIMKLPGGTNLGDYLATAGKTVNNVISQADTTIESVIDTSKNYAGNILLQVQNGISGNPDDVLKTIASIRDVTDSDLVDITKGGNKASLVKQLDSLIGKQASDITRGLLSSVDPQTLIDTPAAYFYDLAVKATNHDDLIANISLVPDYANHFYIMGATLRAAQLAALEDPVFRKYTAVKIDRPGGGVPGSSFMTRLQKESLVKYNIMAQ